MNNREVSEWSESNPEPLPGEFEQNVSLGGKPVGAQSLISVQDSLHLHNSRCIIQVLPPSMHHKSDVAGISPRPLRSLHFDHQKRRVRRV
jgi:hypothetical protein